jgi:threonine dehydratase
MTVSFENITAAAAEIAGVVVRTPTVYSAALSRAFGAKVYLKLEVLQRTGSFKDRGALVKLLSLTDKQRKTGVIAISAGNHAQGVAYHAQRLGVPATIVMPEATPFTKITRTEAFGARVLLHGESVNAAEPYARELARTDSLTFVHPYDDDKIIAGQETIAMEMLVDVEDLDTIVVPIGGGGLIAGIATAAKAISPKLNNRCGSRSIPVDVRNASRASPDCARRHDRRGNSKYDAGNYRARGRRSAGRRHSFGQRICTRINDLDDAGKQQSTGGGCRRSSVGRPYGKSRPLREAQD